jgi:DMSO/TMAO reductase YedYZ molybdopterin-dependent catalytic subunit
MNERRIVSLLLTVFLLAACLPFLGGIASTQAVAATRTVNAETGATPHYRTFLGADLKSMPYEGGYYSCLKASAPFRYFHENWYGVSLSYLLNTEVGMKAGTTGIKVIASDGYTITLTPAEVNMTNPDGLHTILAWKKGAENDKNGPLEELTADGDGPFRLIVPQATIGAHGVGTDNFNRAVRWVRAIEVQPTPPGMQEADGSKISPGQVLVYGNVCNRRTFTVNQIKSIKQVTAKYHWLNSGGFTGDSTFTGIPLAYFLDSVVGLPSGVTKVDALAGDGYPTPAGTPFSIADVRKTYPKGLQTMIVWNEDGKAISPGPPYTHSTSGPLRIVVPQNNPSEQNTDLWVKYLRVLKVDPYGTDPVPDASLVPSDRLIVCGDTYAGNTPSKWYLAEGYTGGGFEEWICIGNPNPWKTQVDITYMIQGESNKSQKVSVDAMSRTTVKVNDAVGPGKNVSALVEGHEGDSIVVERAMYWGNKTGGHCAAGVNDPAKKWYLAEGCTAGGFETWVLLQNPGSTGALVKVTYMNKSGSQAGPTINMPAHSRTTVNVADTLPGDWDVSTQVVSDVPVIAERAMYWANRKAGHDAVGVTSPGTEWYMAEGCTANSFETWVLLQNPGDTAAKASVTYMNESGAVAGPTIDIPAHSRKSVNVADTLPNDMQVSTKVTSDKPVIAERSVYWNGRQGGSCETAVGSPKFKSLLAEGATDGGFESWILIQNPGPVDATVYITYLTDKGAKERAPLTVASGKRVSVNEFDDVGASYQVSAQVNSTAAVAVERAVYWNNRIEGTCSKGYLTW